MLVFESGETLSGLFELHQWERVPDYIVTAENHVMDTSRDIWDIPYTLLGNSTLRFTQIKSSFARTALKLYCMDRARTVSSHAALAVFNDCWQVVFLPDKIGTLDSNDDIKENLKKNFDRALAKAKKDRQLWRMYRPIRWYVWCAENHSELGFCEDYAFELNSIQIPGNPKGEAVKNEDVDKGPLHRTLELQQLINAMQLATDGSLRQLQERAALALCISHGRNPANLALLLEKDLVNLTPESDTATWIVRYPRIKKRLKNPRDDMREVPISALYAGYILDLIQANREVDCRIDGVALEDKPLFLNVNQNGAAIKCGRFDQAFNYPTSGITSLLRSFVRRHNIVSPLSNLPLILSGRRLRYTLATNLVIDGISRRQLAFVLDHSDLQHVEVYFSIARDIVAHLDKALEGYYKEALKFFRGKVVGSNEEAVNAGDNGKVIPYFETHEDVGVCGKSSLCSLSPPYSCYICPKFQAYLDADHESVYEHLMVQRTATIRMGNKKMAEQLDEIIYAVAEVVDICKKLRSDSLEV